MPISLTNEMMRSIIMDHYSNPNNKHEPADATYQKVHMHSDNCIDNIDVYLSVSDGVVKDACFTGIACTISTASTDIMCDLLKDKTVKEAEYIIAQYNAMMHEEPFDADVLEEAGAFVNTHRQAARIRCATIGWNAASEILKDK